MRGAVAARFEGRVHGGGHNGGRVGYLRLPTFGTPAVQDSALAFLARHPALAALVLDVRGNSGGDTPGRLLTALMDRPYRTTVRATPMAPALLRAYFPNGQFRWASETVAPEGTPYAGRLVVVADAGCGSACEDLLIPLKDTGRAVLVGDTTAGSTGQPYVRRLPNGMQIVVGMKREAFPDGRPFEGVGVAPDVRAGPTADDLRAGRDPALDRALALARAAGD